MSFSRMNSGAAAGFLAAGASGPVYVLIAVLAPFDGDVLDLSPDLGPGLLLAIPLMVVSGFVFAGVPSILAGMVLGLAIGDRLLSHPVVGATLGIGALAGTALLRSVDETGRLTWSLALVGAIGGIATAAVWLRVFDFLRSRKPTEVVSDDVRRS